MHMAATEVKKLSKFGTKGHMKRTFVNKVGTMPQSQNGTNAHVVQRQRNPREIGRDPASL
jgi:hypothetical protein